MGAPPMMAPGMMAPPPMTGAPQGSKSDPPSYVELDNEISCWCRGLCCLAAPDAKRREFLRIPNATCNMPGCNKKAYGQCQGDYKYNYDICFGICKGPVLWRGCGRTVCTEHMKYFSWGDGMNHCVACTHSSCAEELESKKWYNYCAGGCACCIDTCFRESLEASKRKCTPEGQVVNR